MRYGENILRVGAPGSGKSLATALSVVESDGAEVVDEPHKDSLALEILTHAQGNILHAKLSDLAHTIGFDLLDPSSNPDFVQRSLENHRRAEAFVEILLRRRDTDGMASKPLMEEWIFAMLMLFLFQKKKKPLAIIPFAFQPDTEQFAALLQDSLLPDVRQKFKSLEKLNPRALRSEVGSAARLVNPVFRSPIVAAWSRGGFDFGSFLQKKGKLIVEKGNEIGDDTMRFLMCAINILAVDHAKRRPHPHPTIRIRQDEATNARLASEYELRGAAETNKNGLYWEFNVQKDFPGGSDAVLQLCHRREWYRCQQYELARKGAVDVVGGLPSNGESRAERIAAITNEIMNFKPGERYVRDARGARKEYTRLLQNGWPDWPGLRESRLEEKLRWIYSRAEYRVPDEQQSENSSKPETRQSDRSRGDSSPASRLKRREKKRVDGSASSDDASA